MKGTAERRSLPLAAPFGIARGTTETAEVVVVRVADDEGNDGVGAAAPCERFGETADGAAEALPDLLAELESIEDSLALQAVETRLRAFAPDQRAARAAVSGACHDLAARRVGVPLYRQLGLDPDRAPPTSFTLGLADPPTTRERAREAVAAGHDVLKVKVGGEADRERLAAVREVAPDATLRVDANEAWSPGDAPDRIDALAEFDVEFVEQPIPAGDPGALAAVREASPVAIAADESVVDLADVPRVADAADVVVVKLAKAGGVRPAIRQVHAARAHGLDVMLGCMVAPAPALAPAMHLAPLVDHADLDGAMLLAEDPFEGVPTSGSEVRLGDVDRPGTGVRERET